VLLVLQVALLMFFLPVVVAVVVKVAEAVGGGVDVDGGGAFVA
jgi:hypothetical protein